MSTRITLTKEADIRLLSDPYRIRILDTFKSFGRPATVKQVADRMGDTSAKVTFHVKKLLPLGLLALDHTEQVNGITAKYYRLEFDEIAVSPPDDKSTVQFQPMLDAVVRMLQEDIRALKDSRPKQSLVSHGTLYLTDKESESFKAALAQLMEQYGTPHEGAEPFAHYHALLEKVKKPAPDA